MLDPHVRAPLTHDGAGRFSATLQVPDVYGVFKWVLDYRRLGYSYVELTGGGSACCCCPAHALLRRRRLAAAPLLLLCCPAAAFPAATLRPAGTCADPLPPRSPAPTRDGVDPALQAQ